MRAFVAVELPGFRPPEGIRGPLEGAPPHLTVRFLGDLGEDRRGPVEDAVRRVADASRPFDLLVRGVGAFPAPDRPRIVYAGVAGGSEELGRIASDLDRAFEPIGFPPEPRPFRAHVTLLRVRSPSDVRLARSLLGTGSERPMFSRSVDALVLFESHLGPGGARHTPIGRFPLGGGVAGVPPFAAAMGPRQDYPPRSS